MLTPSFQKNIYIILTPQQQHWDIRLAFYNCNEDVGTKLQLSENHPDILVVIS